MKQVLNNWEMNKTKWLENFDLLPTSIYIELLALLFLIAFIIRNYNVNRANNEFKNLLIKQMTHDST